MSQVSSSLRQTLSRILKKSDVHEALVGHLAANAVQTDGPFTLRSGQVSDYYIDARQTTFDGLGARLVGEAMLEALADDVVAVGGLTMGADPISVATAVVAERRGRPLRAFSIRKAAKEHGTGGRLVGPVHSGDQVAMIDDTVTTGGALLEAIGVAESEGLSVVQAICLVDRSGGVLEEKLAVHGIPYRAIVVPADLGVS